MFNAAALSGSPSAVRVTLMKLFSLSFNFFFFKPILLLFFSKERQGDHVFLDVVLGNNHHRS